MLGPVINATLEYTTLVYSSGAEIGSGEAREVIVGPIKVVGGDFRDDPGARYSGYFWGSFVLVDAKKVRGQSVVSFLSITDDVVEMRLSKAGASTLGPGLSGAARGAMLLSGSGPVGIAAGAVVGALFGAAATQAKRDEAQRFEILFVDGRKLDAEADPQLVAKLVEKVTRARAKKPLQVIKKS